MTAQVSRAATAGGDDEVHLEIADDDIHIRLDFTMEQFARFITGEAHMPIEVRRFFVRNDLKKSKG